MFMYHLKNKIDGENVDVFAVSLEKAQKIASENLGGKPEDWAERF